VKRCTHREHRDVIDLDPSLGQQFLDIAIREAVAQLPAHREDDDLRREPEALEGRTRDRGYRTTTTRAHAATMTGRYDPPPMQQTRF
jgi:hypothetical protein